MLFSENPAVLGEALEAFFPKTVIPRWLNVDEALMELSKHENPRNAKMATLLLQIIERYFEQEMSGRNDFRTAEQIYQHYADQPEPSTKGLRVLLFDDKQILLGEVATSFKALKSGVAIRREVLSPAMEKRATRLLLVLIRPEGPLDATPEERNGWQHLERCARVLDMRMLDYLIIGDGSYFSWNSGCLHTSGQSGLYGPTQYG